MFIRVARLWAALFLLVSALPAFAAHAVASALAGANVSYYWNTNQPSQKVAGQKVMKACTDNAKKDKHTAKCKLMGTGSGPAYIAFFHTKDGSGFGVASNGDRQEALNSAHDYCLRQGDCPDAAAKVDFDEGEQQFHPDTSTPTGKSCRPKTQPIRCESSCVNGACVVSYQNGCKIRVQVSPRFDPFTSQWIYPSPPC